MNKNLQNQKKLLKPIDFIVLTETINRTESVERLTHASTEHTNNK